MSGIQSFGAYVPRLRLQRSAIYAANEWFAPGLRKLATGVRAVANWDEDVVTMAVEAARDCLGEIDRQEISSIVLASTTAPFAVRQNAGIIKQALNLRDAVSTADFGGSLKAGTSALIQALHTSEATGLPVLAIASEQPRARPASEEELQIGDAAAAFVVGPGDGLARFIGSHSFSTDFIDQFRPFGEMFGQAWEGRWVREKGYAGVAAEALAGALTAHGIPAAKVSRFICGIGAPGAAALIARTAGLAAETVCDDLAQMVGSPGCAHPLVLLSHALETAAPGELLVVLGWGQGADVLLIETTPKIAEKRPFSGVSYWLENGRPETNYMKYLVFSGNLKLDLGKRAEFVQKSTPSALYRNRDAVLGLVGSRCNETGEIRFPPSQIGLYQDHPAQEDYPLADIEARILTYTADYLTFSIAPPTFYGLIEFECGGRMTAEFTDVEPSQLSVGARMRMMFRVKSTDQRSGFINYFWKATPVHGSA